MNSCKEIIFLNFIRKIILLRATAYGLRISRGPFHDLTCRYVWAMPTVIYSVFKLETNVKSSPIFEKSCTAIFLKMNGPHDSFATSLLLA